MPGIFIRWKSTYEFPDFQMTAIQTSAVQPPETGCVANGWSRLPSSWFLNGLEGERSSDIFMKILCLS